MKLNLKNLQLRNHDERRIKLRNMFFVSILTLKIKLDEVSFSNV